MSNSPTTKSLSASDIQSVTEAPGASAPLRGEKRRRVSNDDYKDLNIFKQEMKEMMVAMMTNQNKRIEELEKRLFDKIQSSNSDLDKTLGIMSGQLNDLQNKIDHLEHERKDISKQLKTMDNRIDAMERNCRKTSIEVRGVPKRQQEKKQDLFSLAHNLLRTLKVDFQQADLKDAFRLPVRMDATKSTLVIELSNTLLKTNIIEAYRKFNKAYKLTSHHLRMTGEESRLFLSEHMTAKDKQLHFQAKDFAKNEGYTFCWVANGRVYLREKEGAPHILVKDEEVFKQLKIKK